VPILPDNSHSVSLSISVVCYQSDKQELRQLIASILSAIGELRIKELDDDAPPSGILADGKIENNKLDPEPKLEPKRAELDRQDTLQSIPVYLIDNSELSELSLTAFEDSQLQADHLGVELRLIHGHGNVGYGAAHNLLINELESDFHLMLNPDVVLDKQFLAVGINYLIGHKDVALIVPMASHKNGERQFLCKRYPSVFTLFVRGFLPRNSHKLFTKRLARYEMRDLHAERINDEIPIASGCCMLTRSSALTAIKGFDARYFLYFEDFDLSLRIRQQGRIAYLPTMKIVHGGGYAARKGFSHVRMFVRSAIRFFATHGWRWFKQ
jgi:GT2 family glycosyltransferase